MTNIGNTQKTGDKNLNVNEYDCLFFHPSPSGQIDFYEIKLDEKYQSTESHTNMADSYHIALFDFDAANNECILSENFDAMLLDPYVYVTDTLGYGLQGCILRKTKKSDKFFDDWIQTPHKFIDLIGMEVVKIN